jgi:hypothetical protein
MTRAYNTATTQQNSGGAVSPYVAGKNIVINGGFDIWQRGTSVSATGSVSNYSADRWGAYNSNTAFTISRQATGDTTNLPDVQYCARVQRNSGSDSSLYMYFYQSIETSNSIPFAGKTVTLSFYARKGANFSDGTSVFRSGLSSGTGTDQNWLSGYTGDVTSAINPTLTTTWQRFTLTRTIPTTAKELGVWFEHRGSGTAGANDYYEVTGIQVEVGPAVTPFTRAGGDIQGELAKCQRYYYRREPNSAAGGYGIATVSAFATGSGYARLDFPITMRIVPTLSVSATASHYRAYVNDLVNLTGISLQTAGKDYALISVQVSGGGLYAVGAAGFLSSDTSGNGFLAFSAEL